ncbi:MAG: hypothetical protein IEMM0008_1413 [bacterium]|nr:MAG: hypothetical protein IEMM0008_1413 [bacterium]
MWLIEILIRSFPFILLAFGYFVFYHFKKWLPTWGLSDKWNKRILRAYRILLVLFALPWLTLTIYGHNNSIIHPEWYRLTILYPAWVWLTVHLILFLKLLIYDVLKLITWPGVHIYRRFRPSNEVDTSRRQWLKKSIVALPIGLFAINTIGVYGSDNYVVNRIKIPIKNLSSKLKNFKITQISDLHFGPFMDDKKFADYARVIHSLKSDIIVVTGDIIHSSHELIPMAARALNQLEAKGGVYGCLGNHEYFAGVRAFRKVFKGSKVDILINESRRIDLYGEELYLMGTDYSRGQEAIQQHLKQTLATIPPSEAPKILLAHHPNTFYEAKNHSVDLTLSGHTHGGQIVLGKVGRTYLSLGQLAFRYVKGHYEENESQLYVNSGLGHWLPLRLNCPPEITQFILV